MPSPRWCWVQSQDRSLGADSVEKYAISSKPQLRVAHGSQAQRRQAGAGTNVTAHVEAAGLLIPGLAETWPEQAAGRRRGGAVGDEVDFAHPPSEAFAGPDLEGACREVVMQRCLADRPGDHRPRGARFAEGRNDSAPVGPLQRRRKA